MAHRCKSFISYAESNCEPLNDSPEGCEKHGGHGGIGRRARLRFWFERVQVQVLLAAWKNIREGR